MVTIFHSPFCERWCFVGERERGLDDGDGTVGWVFHLFFLWWFKDGYVLKRDKEGDVSVGVGWLCVSGFVFNISSFER